MIALACGSRLGAQSSSAPQTDVDKGHSYDQTALGVPVADPTLAFYCGLDGTVAMSVTPPGLAAVVVPFSQNDQAYSYFQSFTSQAALDAAFPNGNYIFSATGYSNFTLSLTGDLYPNVPQITNGSWNSSGQLVIDPTQNTAINFNAFTSYGAGGGLSHMDFRIQPYNGGSTKLDEAYITPTNPSPFTSYSISAGTLSAGCIYYCHIQFDTAIAENTAAPAGGSVTAYSTVTYFTIVTSGTATNLPTITQQPTNQTASLGSNVTFSVGFGGGNFEVQWFKNGIPINQNNQSSSNLTLTNIQNSDAGSYFVVLVNQNGGYVQSNTVALTIGSPAAVAPTITVQPVSQNLVTGSNLALSVTASGSGPLTYQWLFNNQAITIDGSKYVSSGASLTVNGLTSADAGNYSVNVSNSAGAVSSVLAAVSVSPAIVAPSISISPQSATISSGGSVVLAVFASGSTPLSYQWELNSTPIGGATGQNYTASTAGNYTVVVSNSAGSATSAIATVSVGTPVSSLINISTRAQVGTGGNILIPGFVVSGNDPIQLLIRADGPALAQFGVAGALAQPQLTVYNGQTVVASNTGWSSGTNAAQIASAAASAGAFALAPGSADCALLLSLPGGAYTVQVSGVNNSTGVALAEIYQLAPSNSQLVNISTRAVVGTGGNVLIPGDVVSGNSPKRLLIRAVGPGLAAFGVTGVIAHPYLEVYNGQTLIANNAGWSNNSNASDIAAAAASAGAFALTPGSGDCTLLMALPPAGYTVHVSGVGSTTGVALVEIYVVP